MNRTMLLVVDVGNTNTVFGVYRFDARSNTTEADPPELLASWRMETRKGRTADEYAAMLHGFFALFQVTVTPVGDGATTGVP